MKTLIAFIVVFGLIVLVHEFGHFYVAKKAGVRIREFAIGMGPKLFQTRKNGTTYTLRILPVGGYVRMAGRGEDESDSLRPGMTVTVVETDGLVTRINQSDQVELVGGRPFIIDDADLVNDLYLQGYWSDNEEELVKLAVDHDATMIEADGTEVLIAPADTQFQSAKLWQRALINVAGPFNNFVLTLVLFIGLAFALPGVTTTTIKAVRPDSPAALAGLKPGDTITAVNQQKVTSWQGLQGKIQPVQNKRLVLTYQRQHQSKKAVVKPQAVEIQGNKVGQIGIMPATTTALGARLKYAFQATGQAALQIWRAIVNLVQDFSLNKLGGPVAIYKSTEQASDYGLLSIVAFTAMLSINLGMMNLLPIPALDGGKLVMNGIEAITGHPVSEKIEVALTVVGALVLVVLMVLVTGNDILRYFIN